MNQKPEVKIYRKSTCSVSHTLRSISIERPNSRGLLDSRRGSISVAEPPDLYDTLSSRIKEHHLGVNVLVYITHAESLSTVPLLNVKKTSTTSQSSCERQKRIHNHSANDAYMVAATRDNIKNSILSRREFDRVTCCPVSSMLHFAKLSRSSMPAYFMAD